MKKIILFSSAAIVATLFVATTTGNAASSSLTTDGKVSFTADNNETGSILKPDETGNTQEKIEITEGKGGSGGLRIQFVPNLTFVGVDNITSDAQTQDVKVLPYTQSGTPGKIVPFVQVTNNSGENPNWVLTAKATEFKTAANEVLTGAYISLNESTLTSTASIDSTEAETLVSSFTPGKIPTDGTSISVLSAKTGAITNGKQWSNVFHENYVKDQAVTGDKTSGATFVKPAGIAASAKEYTAQITWTLTDGK